MKPLHASADGSALRQMPSGRLGLLSRIVLSRIVLSRIVLSRIVLSRIVLSRIAGEPDFS